MLSILLFHLLATIAMQTQIKRLSFEKTIIFYQLQRKGGFAIRTHRQSQKNPIPQILLNLHQKKKTAPPSKKKYK